MSGWRGGGVGFWGWLGGFGRGEGLVGRSGVFEVVRGAGRERE